MSLRRSDRILARAIKKSDLQPDEPLAQDQPAQNVGSSRLARLLQKATPPKTAPPKEEPLEEASPKQERSEPKPKKSRKQSVAERLSQARKKKSSTPSERRSAASSETETTTSSEKKSSASSETETTTSSEESRGSSTSTLYGLLDMNVPYRPYQIYYVPSDWRLMNEVIQLNADIKRTYGTDETMVTTLLTRVQTRHFPDIETGLVSTTLYVDDVVEALNDPANTTNSAFRILLREDQLNDRADNYDRLHYAILTSSSSLVGSKLLDIDTVANNSYKLVAVRSTDEIRSVWYSQLMQHINTIMPKLIPEDDKAANKVMYSLLTEKELSGPVEKGTSKKKKMVFATEFPIAFVSDSVSLNYNYQVMELLGDKVTNLQVLWKAMTTTRIENTAQSYTNLLQYYASDVKQSQIAESLQLHKYVQGYGIRNSSYKLKEDVLEAFLGVIYVIADQIYPDGSTAELLMMRIIDNLFKFAEKAKMAAPTQLSNWADKLGVIKPKYIEHGGTWYVSLRNEEVVGTINSYLKYMNRNPIKVNKFKVEKGIYFLPSGESRPNYITIYSVGQGPTKTDAATVAANYLVGTLPPQDIDRVKLEQDLKLLRSKYPKEYGFYENSLSKKYTNIQVMTNTSDQTNAKRALLVGASVADKHRKPIIITRAYGRGGGRTNVDVLRDLIMKYAIKEGLIK